MMRWVAVLATSLLVTLSVLPIDASRAATPAAGGSGLQDGTLTVLPDDGPTLYLEAFDSARRQIRIEICVLEDPVILQGLMSALQRGVGVRVIVDQGKYNELPSEAANFAQYVTSAGGELHLSNPVFPRSFPKVILIDSRLVIYGSACLDETTFLQYRDFAHATTDRSIVRSLLRLFENDWKYTAPVGEQPAPFNPTPPIDDEDLIVSPVNGASQLVPLFQSAYRTLDVYTELLGNPVLEGELFAAVERGVRVRLIAPLLVNGATPEIQQQQIESLTALAAAGVDTHVSGPDQTATQPYMHARAAVVDGTIGFLGSISLSPDATTVNREVGVILRAGPVVRRLARQFGSDFRDLTTPFPTAATTTSDTSL